MPLQQFSFCLYIFLYVHLILSLTIYQTILFFKFILPKTSVVIQFVL
jgi:hypothetical protein